MGIWDKVRAKAREVRTSEKIRPLLESRMMRDIILEISQRGTERLDPQSVPVALREKAAQAAGSCGATGLQQSVVDEVRLDASGIVLNINGEEATFLYADYNYEDIEDTDCLADVARHLVQHMQGYYSISKTFQAVPDAKSDKTHQVFIKRHHEESPFEMRPARKQKLF